MANFLIAFLVGVAYSHRGRTRFRTPLKKSVEQVLVPELIFVGDVLDDAPLHQSVSVDDSFATVRRKADFDEPVHQVTAAEGPSGSLCTTPSFSDDVSNAQVTVVMYKLLTGHFYFLRNGGFSVFCCFFTTPQKFKPSFERKDD